MDKFSAGFVIFFIGNTSAFSQKHFELLTDDERAFIKYMTIVIPGAACILATLIVVFYPVQEYKSKDEKVKKNPRSSIADELVS